MSRTRRVAHLVRNVGVLDSLLPVFLIIGLGATLTAGGWLAPEFLKGLNRLAYWVGMPGMLFASVCRAELVSDRPLRIFGVLLAGTLVAGLAGYVAARGLRLPKASVGTFVQATFRGNLAFLALPVTVYTFGRAGSPESAESVAPVVALAIAPLMILYNVFAAAVLLASQHGFSRATAGQFTRQLFLHPLVLAIAAGLAVSALHIPVPDFLFASVQTIGGLAIPAALFGVGGTLVTSPVRSHLKPAIAGTLIKVALTPLVGVVLARALGFSPVDVKIIAILLAAPTAAASFIMTTQMKGDVGLASSMVFLTTLLSLGSLAIVIALV